MSRSIRAANREALERLLRARPAWTGVLPAAEALGLRGRALLHAGPPIAWERMCEPMRGAIVALVLLEGWARDVDEALALAGSGEIALAPCHSRGAVGPMTGVISPSLPVVVVDDPVHGTRACSYIGEGSGPQAKFGAHAPEVLERLRFIRDVVGPALHRAVEAEGPLDLVNLMAQALAMGDEMHMRNAAATALLVRAIAAPLARALPEPSRLEAVLRFMTRDNDQLFLTWAMCAAKTGALAMEGAAGSSLVTVMARNGVEFGIRVAGLGDAWFTAPAPLVSGAFFPGFTEADANPDIGDSAIMETYGLGGMAMAASPAVLRIVGGQSFAEAVATTQRMAEITVGRNPNFGIGALDGEGSPTGIDVRRVVETGHVPAINTAITHRRFGVGRMIGAGIATPPLQPFVDALVALGRAQGAAAATAVTPR